MDCEVVREGDYIDRYVAGRLSEAEAEAFEAHYFACETCWRDLESALGARAAMEAEETPQMGPPRRGRRWATWATAAGVAAAAAVLTLFILNLEPSGEGGPPTGAFRGEETALEVQTGLTDGSLTAEWTGLPDADVYVARIYTVAGDLLYEREVSAPRAEVARAEVLDGAAPAVVYWRILALDSLRQPIARSPLRPLRVPSP